MIENPIVANPGLRGGSNVRLTVNSLGVLASTANIGGKFTSFYKVALNPKYCTVAAGTIQSDPLGKDGVLTPTINGIAIGGDTKNQSPRLALDPSLADPDTGLSSLVIAVTPKTDGTLDTTTPVIVQHVANPNSPPAGTYYDAIASILWRTGLPFQVKQIVWFNKKFFLKTPAAGQGAPAGYFIAV